IGGEVARLLLERGDEVVARGSTPARAGGLTGCELVAGDLADIDALQRGVKGADAVIHAAAVYEIGIPASARAAMTDVNVGGTSRVLTAALEAGVSKAVYVSTVAVFGNTRGEVADERWTRVTDGFTSAYEQTKVEAHHVAQALVARGLPLVTVQPGVVYGPGDTSELGGLFDRLLKGKLPLVPFPTMGITPVHRDDVVNGILLALDKGVVDESYVLAGETTTMGSLLRALAEVSGKKPPRGAAPTWLLKGLAPFGRFVGPMMGFPPNMKELISSSDGVTFWARSDKAQRELGWTYRPLPEGLATLLA
ncbi:MAG: NAD-dependent epimerase/dehydratase, partial [Frankiales bacterium]|nr:NAD-dependent epimerase/dehydratase [Frankiales bacterium]